MSSASSVSAARSGTRSTACPTAVRFRRRSGRRGRSAGGPPAGYFTKRLAEDWLRDVLDEARRGTLAGHGADRRDVRRRGGRVAALRRARPAAQAVDGCDLPIARSARSCCRRSATMRDRGDHDRDDRVAGSPGSMRTPSHTGEAARDAPRHLPARSEGIGPAGQPGARRREAAACAQRRHRGLLPRGGLGAGPRRGDPSRTRRSS